MAVEEGVADQDVAPGAVEGETTNMSVQRPTCQKAQRRLTSQPCLGT